MGRGVGDPLEGVEKSCSGAHVGLLGYGMLGMGSEKWSKIISLAPDEGIAYSLLYCDTTLLHVDSLHSSNVEILKINQSLVLS